MVTAPVSLRLDKDILELLAEGKRRTPLNGPELIRRTLRLHLRAVIEANTAEPSKITSISPCPAGALKSAYQKATKDWEHVEAAAVAAQGAPCFED